MADRNPKLNGIYEKRKNINFYIFAGFKANALLDAIYYFVNLKLSINQGQVRTTVNKQTTSMQKLKK